MHCPNCGYENVASATFCAQCGYELAEAPHTPPEPGLHVETEAPVPPSAMAPPSVPTRDAGNTMHAGQYRVVRPLGRGGMGAIYLAENTRAFDRLCVIKELVPYYEAGEEQDAALRFEQEARTLAALKHPGIPDMYGYFTETGRHYIVMEYIEGPTLADLAPVRGMRAGDRAKAADLALWAGIEICRVLAYLARAGASPVVHADIKPDNIIVNSGNGRAVLVDFGTAQAMSLGRRAARDRGRSRSQIYGTPGYAAPELYRGYATPASDVYALAASLYLALTGDDPAEHPMRFPMLGTLPEPLAGALRSCLSSDPRRRLSAEQLRARLQDYRALMSAPAQTALRAQTVRAPTRARAPRRARPQDSGFGRTCIGLLLLVLAVLIALAIAATYLLGPDSPLRQFELTPYIQQFESWLPLP